MNLRTIAIAPVLLMIAGLAASCSSAPIGAPDGSAGDFCVKLCAQYLPCADAPTAPEEVRTPLFCGGSMAMRTESCEALCGETLEALGDSESDFLTCATCTLPRVGADACDENAANDAGRVACADSCASIEAGNAASVFAEGFRDAMLASDAARCEPATKTFAASDPSVAHDHGRAEGSTWVCSSTYECSGIDFIEVSSITLAPGSYTAGVTGLSVTALVSIGPVAKLLVQGAFEGHFEKTITAAEAAAGSLSVDFSVKETSEMTMKLKLYGATGAAVGEVFFTRH